MRFQTFNFPPQITTNTLIPVALEPGKAAMVYAVAFNIVIAAASQPLISFTETGQAIISAVYGPVAAVGVQQNISAFLDAPESAAQIVLDPVGVNISLPRYIFRENFVVTVGSNQIAALDDVSDGRVVVLFGTVEELLTV